MNLRLGITQFDFVVGDIAHNTNLILDACYDAHSKGISLLVTPELALCGYAAEDLFLRPSFIKACQTAITKLQTQLATLKDFALIIGHPSNQSGQLFNCASVLSEGKCLATYAKQKLPNYQVFDEKRYFFEGTIPCVITLFGLKIGLLICEDAWFKEPAAACKTLGAELLISINASPYHIGKCEERQAVICERCTQTHLPIIYAHIVGGQDELVFDGYSFALNTDGTLAGKASGWQEELYEITLHGTPDNITIKASITPCCSDLSDLWQGLVLSVKDYIKKSGFPSVLLGLSGGIDSALVLAIAVDALGANKVSAVMMPSPYTAAISWQDAAKMAKHLGVAYEEITISPLFEAFNFTLAPLFEDRKPDTTEENLQARIRGVLLMALSNKTGSLVLTTGNKSEMATGYCTLYGDMAGGFAVIKDLLKTQVYALAHWRNQNNPFNQATSPIPERIITRPPSAELKPDQTDQDSLPPYDILDKIITAILEHNQSIAAIVANGYDRPTVERVMKLIKNNEYKRRQAPIGPRLSKRAFGKDWRYPICNQFCDFGD